jgi:hypothetical protein
MLLAWTRTITALDARLRFKSADLTESGGAFSSAASAA